MCLKGSRLTKSMQESSPGAREETSVPRKTGRGSQLGLIRCEQPGANAKERDVASFVGPVSAVALSDTCNGSFPQIEGMERRLTKHEIKQDQGETVGMLTGNSLQIDISGHRDRDRPLSEVGRNVQRQPATEAQRQGSDVMAGAGSTAGLANNTRSRRSSMGEGSASRCNSRAWRGKVEQNIETSEFGKTTDGLSEQLCNIGNRKRQ